jgi:hypothetical protein
LCRVLFWPLLDRSCAYEDSLREERCLHLNLDLSDSSSNINAIRVLRLSFYQI